MRRRGLSINQSINRRNLYSASYSPERQRLTTMVIVVVIVALWGTRITEDSTKSDIKIKTTLSSNSNSSSRNRCCCCRSRQRSENSSSISSSWFCCSSV